MRELPNDGPALLTPDDPTPFEVVNRDGGAHILLVCDHASNVVPSALGTLGLSDDTFERHIAYDIGAAAVTRGLADRLDASAVLAGYSRLVIDVNRPPGHRVTRTSTPRPAARASAKCSSPTTTPSTAPSPAFGTVALRRHCSLFIVSAHASAASRVRGTSVFFGTATRASLCR